jgi:mRNA-degrading endonuclease toxin of MazEF toxin-antitoxin module
MGDGDPRDSRHFRIALSRSLAHNRVMLAKVCSAAVNGIEAYPVEVEVNAGFGDTLIVIVVNKTPKAFLG